MLIAAKVNLLSVYKWLSGTNPAHVHTPKCSQISINTGNKQFRLNGLAEQWGNGSYEEGVCGLLPHTERSGRSFIAAISTPLTTVPVFEGLFQVIFFPIRYVSACVFIYRPDSPHMLTYVTLAGSASTGNTVFETNVSQRVATKSQHYQERDLPMVEDLWWARFASQPSPRVPGMLKHGWSCSPCCHGFFSNRTTWQVQSEPNWSWTQSSPTHRLEK